MKLAVLLSIAFVLCTSTAQAQSDTNTPSAQVVPSEFVDGRVFVLPVTTSGDTIRFFTDTGGSPVSQINDSVVQRLGLPTESLSLAGRTVELLAFPEFQTDRAISPILVDDQNPVSAALAGRLAVRPDQSGSDGMLGQLWHGGRVWTFDYRRGRLLLHPSSDGMSFDPEHTVAIGFQTDASGRRVQHFPSIEATIDGESFWWLLDTGATIALTEDAVDALSGPATRAASFVTARTFDRWRERNPDWKVVDGADANAGGEPVIIVPDVQIAGHTVGPALFVRREDSNYDEFMSQWMARPIEGALGGSVFQHFVMTIDYPNALAHFER